jgi:hypothetical protein
METPTTMVFHGFLIALALYILLRTFTNQSMESVHTKAIFTGLVAAAYMIAFGHNLPTQVNPRLLY